MLTYIVHLLDKHVRTHYLCYVKQLNGKLKKVNVTLCLAGLSAISSRIILTQNGYPQRFHPSPHLTQRMLRKHVELSQYHFFSSLPEGTFKITLACFFLNDVTLAVRDKVKKGKKANLSPRPRSRFVGDWKNSYYSLPTSTLDRGECLYSRHGRFNFRKEPCLSTV